MALVRAFPHRATSLVYTSDAELQDRVNTLGAQVAGARALLKETAAPCGTVGQSATGRSFNSADGSESDNRVSAELPTSSTYDPTSREPP